MFRVILIALLISLQPTLSSAIDFGSFIKKKPVQENEKAKGTNEQSALSGLVGLAKGTPVEEEIAIGREIAGRLLGAAPLVEDKALQVYVNRVGKWLALQSGRKDIKWRFGVIEANDINAFAAPGGYIFITRGLYKKLNNEAELAGVLAHEIGHVIKKHHLKVLKKSKALSMGSHLLSSQMKGREGEQYIKDMIGNGAEIMARGLDKNAEYEADRIGVVVATRGGYDSYALPGILQEIGHVSADDSSVSLLFKTHPHPDTRLEKLEEAMGDKFDKYADGKTLSGRFYRIKD